MPRIVFMGTPDFAVPSLEALIAHTDYAVVGVVTQPDRPAGRGNELKAPPIKRLAQAQGIPLIQPEKLRFAYDTLSAWNADLFIVAAFGQILPQKALDMPKRAAINVHGSLLPRWRGAAPIHAAIRAGDAETGITIMLMDAGLDTGAMLSKQAIAIAPDETAQTLHDKMARLGADLLIETLPRYLAGEITPQVQDEALVTYAPQIEKDEGYLDWSRPAQELERLVRAFTPWPSTFTTWQGKQLKIHRAALEQGEVGQEGEVGQVVMTAQGVGVATGAGVLLLKELQLEGKKRLSIEDFVRGQSEFLGSKLGG
jgi:methionyl-tRNA formyltransferase